MYRTKTSQNQDQEHDTGHLRWICPFYRVYEEVKAFYTYPAATLLQH